MADWGRVSVSAEAVARQKSGLGGEMPYLVGRFGKVKEDEKGLRRGLDLAGGSK